MSKERWDEIVRWVDDEGRVALASLAGRFEVSEMTIRRDLDALTGAGRLRRVRGGAVSLTTPAPAATARPAPQPAPQPASVIEPLADTAPPTRVPSGAPVDPSDAVSGPELVATGASSGDVTSGALPSPEGDPSRAPSSLGSVIASWAGRFPGGFPAPEGTTSSSAERETGRSSDDVDPRPATPPAPPATTPAITAPRAGGVGDPWGRAATAACRGLAPGSAVLLTGGAGSLALAHHLADLAAHSPAGTGTAPGAVLTVAATALAPAAVLAGSPGVRLVLLGGEAEAAGGDLVGPSALAALEDLHLDLALLTPTGLDSRGAWAATSAAAALVSAAVARASRTVAVVESAALGRPGLVRAAGLAALAQVVAVPAAGDDALELADRLAALRAAAPTAPDVVAA